MSDQEYRALVSKVDEFCGSFEDRAGDALSCHRGCNACCHVWLTVSPVEARAVRAHLAGLPPTARAEIAARGHRERAREAHGEQPARCAMLDDDGACGIYEARPLLCRTQGLALQYPPNTVPEATVRFVGADGSQIVACPLNYTERTPRAEEMLNADMLNTLLALVNQRDCDETGGDPELRSPLTDLAAGDLVIG